MTHWLIELTETALGMLNAIKDTRERGLILRRIRGLEHDPIEQGKPLIGPLQGYYSVRAAGQRYRIIYQVLPDRVVVLVVALGIRKEHDKRDIYSLAQRLVRLGLLQRERDDET